MSYVTWFIAFIVFLGVELITISLVTLWFAVGALIAFVAALLGAPTFVQILLFIVVSVVCIIFVKPFAQNYINNNTTKTNVEAVAGKTAKVVVQINNIEGTGTILIDGLEWTARTEDESVLDVGDLVTVLRIEGVKAIVEKKKEGK